MLIFTSKIYVPKLDFMYLIDYIAIGTIVTVFTLVGIGVILDYRNARKQNKI